MLEIFKNYLRTYPEEPVRTGYFESLIAVHPTVFALFLRIFLWVQFPSLQNHNRLRAAVDQVIFFAPFSFICFQDLIANNYYIYCIVAYDVLIVFLLGIKVCSYRKTPPSPILPAAASESTRTAPVLQKSGRNTICLFRGGLYVLSITCILGRDLNGFRLIFSKAFYRGTGLMDVGVGFFLFLMGITGPTSRTKPKDFTRERQMAAIMSSTKWIMILLAIGIVKMVVEHETNHLPNPIEYGYSWNVFITLGVLKFVGTLVEIVLCHRCPPVLLALAISGAMEVLQAEGLKFYVFFAQRTTFFSSNREGIVQCAGLLALYLWGLQIGKFMFNTLSLPSSQCCQNSRLMSSPTFKFFLILFVNLVFVMSLNGLLKWKKVIEVESRCLANLSYVLWIVAYCSCVLIICLVGDFVSLWMQGRVSDSIDLSPKDHLLVQIDRNGFVFFIIGNLLTGLYSLNFLEFGSIRDKFAKRSAWCSFLILTGYCSLTTYLSLHLALLPRCLRRCRAFLTKVRSQTRQESNWSQIKPN